MNVSERRPTPPISRSCTDDEKGFTLGELRNFLNVIPEHFDSAFVHTRNGEPLRYADFYPDDKILVIVEAL